MNVEKFSRKIAKAMADLGSRTTLLCEDANPDNVHDVRTSIRKVEAALELLPKKVREKRKIKKYQSACRKLFRSTTPIRDLDIVYSNLLTYANDPNVQHTLIKIRVERSRLIPNCSLNTRKLLKINTPKIDQKLLSSKEIKNRRKKIVMKIQAKLQEGVPIIVNDFRKIDELHDIRKQCKNLRYTLEIIPSKNDDKIVSQMEEWQTILGAVRDIDVTEHFVNERDLSEELEEAIVNLKISRDGMLKAFVRTAKTDPVSVPAN